MSEPKPGEAFEAYGLRWEPGEKVTYWSARINESVITVATYGGEWIGMGRAWPTFAEAIAWAIRSCPRATCATCAHRSAPERSLSGVVCKQWCFDLEPSEDGFCHKWEATHEP